MRTFPQSICKVSLLTAIVCIFSTCKHVDWPGHGPGKPDHPGKIYKEVVYHGTAKLSQPRLSLAAAGAGNKILIAGGSSPFNGLVKTVDVYDVVTGAWTVDSLSEVKTGLTAVALDNKLYFGGGENDYPRVTPPYYLPPYSKRVDIYNVNTGVWTIDSFPGEKANHLCAAAGNKVVFEGGRSVYGNSGEVYIYDTKNRSWDTYVQGQYGQIGRESGAAVAAGNKLFFAGGHIGWGNSPVKIIDIYDVTTNTWSTASLSVARDLLTAIVAGNNVFFAGGIDGGSRFSKVVDVYDLRTGTWRVDSLSVARFGLASAAVSNFVLFAGGIAHGSYSNRVDIFNTATGKWTIDSLAEARYIPTAAAAGNKIIFAGGKDDSGRWYEQTSDIADIFEVR